MRALLTNGWPYGTTEVFVKAIFPLATAVVLNGKGEQYTGRALLVFATASAAKEAATRRVTVGVNRLQLMWGGVSMTFLPCTALPYNLPLPRNLLSRIEYSLAFCNCLKRVFRHHLASCDLLAPERSLWMFIISSNLDEDRESVGPPMALSILRFRLLAPHGST